LAIWVFSEQNHDFHSTKPEHFPAAVAVGGISRALGWGPNHFCGGKKKVVRLDKISYGWAGRGARDGSSPANFSRDDAMLRDEW
jgi:hypothetical protein